MSRREARDDELGTTPAETFTLLRACGDWPASRREALMTRMMSRFEPTALLAAARPRLDDFDALDFEAAVWVVDAYGDEDDARRLARGVAARPRLEPERAYYVLAAVEKFGVLEDEPGLASRWDEIRELLGEDDEVDEDGIGIADELTRLIECEGDVAFIADWVDSLDSSLRAEVVEILSEQADVAAAGAVLTRLKGQASSSVASTEIAAPAASEREVECWVSAVDGAGRGVLLTAASVEDGFAVVAIVCDVLDGVVEVVEARIGSRADLDAYCDARLGPVERDRTGGLRARALATHLVATGLARTERSRAVAIRDVVERVFGSALPHAGMMFATTSDEPGLDHDEAAQASARLLEALPEWRDGSELTQSLAAQVSLKPDGLLDRVRDAGAVRYLAEHRLLGRLDRYRDMLRWMAAFWAAADAVEPACDAFRLAAALDDPQNAVASHPFLVELAARSLAPAAAVRCRD